VDISGWKWKNTKEGQDTNVVEKNIQKLQAEVNLLITFFLEENTILDAVLEDRVIKNK